MLKNKSYKKFYLLSVLFVFLISFYPLYMGLKVFTAMISDGFVLKENYPKYIIPYTPISLAVILAVILMPVFMRILKKYSVPTASAFSLSIFFLIETILEKKVVISSTESITSLADWQMYLCIYFSPQQFEGQTETVVHKTPIEILIGDYDPAFKIHFYIISIILILSFIACIYGFAKILQSGDKTKIKSLIIQSISTFMFLGLCILACFTAFFRNGQIELAPISSFLMSLFFITMGLTAGMYSASFLIGKHKRVSVLIPSVISGLFTLLMYIGELILLNGNLYKFGNSFLFRSLPGIILSTFDIIIILISSLITYKICIRINDQHLKIKNN